MQAIIMAAGKGSRLMGLSNSLPKSFLEIEGRRLIDYNIDMLHKYGINDIVIVTGYHYEEFENLFTNVEGIRLVYNPFYSLVNVLASFWIACDFLQEKDLIYLHADSLCDPTIFEQLIKDDSDITLPVDTKSCDEEAMKVSLANKTVIEINKTMDCNKAFGEFIGIAKIKKEVIPSLKLATDQLMKEQQLDSYFEAAIQRLIDQKKFQVCAFSVRERFWTEIDFPEDYDQAVRDFPDELINI